MQLKKKRWLGLAFAPALFALIGFASPAQANNYNDNCANYPGNFDGNGTVTISNTGTCTLNQAVTATGAVSITSSGSVSTASAISGSSVSINATSGAISATAITSTSGALSLTTTNGAISADTLNASNGALTVNSGTSLTFTNVVQSTNGLVDLKAVNNIQTKKVTAGYGLKIESTTGKIIADGGAATNDALKANNGKLEIISKDLLTITGITTSINGDMELTADKDLMADAISSGYGLKVTSTNGKINITAKVDSNTSNFGGNILLTAKNNIATGDINTHGSTSYGGVEINANTGGTSVLFTIGGSGEPNGVNGSINTSNTTAGGTDPNFIRGGVFITNGTPTSNLGITVADVSKIQVNSTMGRSGLIILNAQDGPLTFAAGTLSSDGAAGGAGQIILMAKTITFGANSVVSATQTQGLAGTSHGITIATGAINFSGSTGLSLKADGDGTGNKSIYLFPQKTVTVSSNSDYHALTWNSTFASLSTIDRPLSFVGTGTAPLFVSADGSNTGIQIAGNATSFSGGKVTLESKGNTNHGVFYFDSGPSNDGKGLTFTSSAALLVDASADTTANAKGGDIFVSTDALSLNASGHTFKAVGPTATGSNGDGGRILISSVAATQLKTSSKVTIVADAASAGTGNAVAEDVANINIRKAIELYPGPVNLDIGTAAGQYSMSAKGGKNGGNGGTVIVSSSPVNILVPNAINASAQGGNGNGGEIYFYSYVNSISPTATLTAIGKGNGQGGKFTAYSFVLGADVNKFIKVDGGANVAAAFNGSISLNGILCQQRKTTETARWPKTYWNCVRPDPAVESSLDKAIGNVLITKLTATARNAVGTRIYVYEFADFASYQGFFSKFPPDQVAGATFMATGTTPNIYSAVTAPLARTEPTLREITVHEIGHALDLLKGRTTQSGHPTYDAFVQNDFFTLDYLTEFGAPYVSRNPCVQTGIVPAPFTSVPAVCGTDGQTIQAAYVGKLNSFILRDQPGAAYFFQKNVAESAWTELYAQELSYEAYISSTVPTPVFAYILEDTVFQSGYFACTRTWAGRVRDGLSTPPTGGTCANPLPSGYGPY